MSPFQGLQLSPTLLLPSKVLFWGSSFAACCQRCSLDVPFNQCPQNSHQAAQSLLCREHRFAGSKVAVIVRCCSLQCIWRLSKRENTPGKQDASLKRWRSFQRASELLCEEIMVRRGDWRLDHGIAWLTGICPPSFGVMGLFD